MSMTRQEMAEAIQGAVQARMGNPACQVTEVINDEDLATFSVHVGGLDADIFHVHVYKEGEE